MGTQQFENVELRYYLPNRFEDAETRRRELGMYQVWLRYILDSLHTGMANNIPPRLKGLN